MSNPLTKEFICPVCGKVIRAPFTEEQITAHLKTHPEEKNSLRHMKNHTIKKIKS